MNNASQEAVKEDFFQSAEPEEEQGWLDDQDASEASSRRVSLGTAPRDPATFPPPTSTPVNPPPPSSPWMKTAEGLNDVPPGQAPPPQGPRIVEDSANFTPLFGGEFDGEDLTATPEEIEKIRRILNDLD